jgi:hypothetical protein
MLPLAFALILAGQTAPAPPHTGPELVARSREISNIFDKPFRLEASLSFHDSKGDYIGTYTILWVNHNEWRDDVQIERHHQTRFRNGTKTFVDRDVSVPEFYGVTSLAQRELLYDIPTYAFKANPSTEADSAHEPLQCVAIKKEFAQITGTTEACFSPKGVYTGDNSAYFFSNVITLDDHQYATEWKLIRSPYHLDVHVTRLQRLSQIPDRSAFAPPTTAEPRIGCFSSSVPTPIVAPRPASPYRNAEGNVLLQATVSESGKVTDIRALSGTPVLTRAFADAVLHWSFAPATCDGIPIPSSVRLESYAGR